MQHSRSSLYRVHQRDRTDIAISTLPDFNIARQCLGERSDNVPVFFIAGAKSRTW